MTFSFSVSYAQSIQIYSTPGTYNFVVPTNVYVIYAKTWGGGGGGSDRNGNSGGGGGGGSGFTGGSINVLPNDIISVTVASGGNRGYGNKDDGSNGGSTIVSHLSGTITATGGNGGTGKTGNGGIGGYGSFSGIVSDQVTYSGGRGGAGDGDEGGGGGGGAGDAQNGTNGADAAGNFSPPGGNGGALNGGNGGNGGNDGPGNDGLTFGGGGGAAGKSGGGGGNGAPGAVILSWTTCNLPDQPILSASNSTICSGNSTTVNIISGNLNDADHWQWYSGSCGGTSLGQGTSITVSPASTTTYYVRGEGNSCNGDSCSTITIFINPASTPDIEVVALDDFCQSSDSDTPVSWTINKISGVGNWNYNYVINDGSTDMASGSITGVTGNSHVVEFMAINEVGVDKTHTITISAVTDSCGTSETNTTNNSDTVTLYGVPATSEINSN